MSGRRAGPCRGQAIVPAIALGVLLLLGVAAATVLGAVHVGAARAQRVADLAAVSAVRALLAGPAPDPRETPAGVRARIAAALRPVLAPDGARLEAVEFPGGAAWPPVSVAVTVSVPGPMGVRIPAVAAAAPRLDPGAGETATPARGGGYAGPLVHRDGRPTCPAVAAAFDLMDAASRRDGVDLVVVSGFRSDAEQAVLFARHPDPRWVAPPGRSRHRDATELDLGVGGAAWAWLARNAGRFGFVQRYSWEPWHYGYLPGCAAVPPVPAAVRARGDRGGGRSDERLWGDAAADEGGGGAPGGERGRGDPGALPSWVPGEYRGLVWRSAAAGGVPPVLLAALLQAESGWRPDAVSPAGARGIAQFMPATARGMGLRDPFDPAQAVPAAARLLGGHLRRFGSVPLALAAYNAGPGAVERYGGVPPYPETQAYVARITALAGGASPAGGAYGFHVVLVAPPAGAGA